MKPCGIFRATVVCNLQADTWQWPSYLDTKTAGECSQCYKPIFYERKNEPYIKVCMPCWQKAKREQVKPGPQPFISMWAVYDHPSDYPEHWVARRFDIFHGISEPVPNREHFFTADTLEEIRNLIPSGLVCLTRSEGDDPCITETWL